MRGRGTPYRALSGPPHSPPMEVWSLLIAMRALEPKPPTWRELGGRQHGIVTRAQLLELGLTTAAISRLVTSGELNRLHRGVYLICGHERSWEARVMAATLLGHGHASHRSAAALWRLTDSTSAPIEVTTNRRQRTLEVVWHRGKLRSQDTTTRNGIPVTSIHRTLIDLGDVVEDDVVEDALDRALERRLTSVEWLTGELDDLGTKGRKGASALRRILVGGYEKASWLERRFIRLLQRSALPPCFREFRVGPYFLDFAWPEVHLGVEVHGAKWHRKRKRWAKDLARHNQLTTTGWTVLHCTWDELRSDPARVIAEIWTTYQRLALRLGLSAR